MITLSFNVSWDRFSNRGTSLSTIPPTLEAPYIDMSVIVVPDWNVSAFIKWTPTLPPDDGLDDDDVSYMVYSSKSELGPFTQITSQPITDTSYFTMAQTQSSKVYEQYLTVEVIYADGRKYRSYPATPSVQLTTWHMLRQRDIIRRERILLDKFVGVETIVYTRKWSGLRCKSCWDTKHLKVMDDHCPECYGTGYSEGYDTGMRTKLQYTSIDPMVSFNYQGTEEPNTISAWGLAFPILHPGAILLRTGDRRAFRVEGHQGSTEMLTTLQRQNVIIKELSRDSIEQSLFNREGVIDIMPRVPHVHT